MHVPPLLRVPLKKVAIHLQMVAHQCNGIRKGVLDVLMIDKKMYSLPIVYVYIAAVPFLHELGSMITTSVRMKKKQCLTK